jgi:hypothetical protein
MTSEIERKFKENEFYGWRAAEGAADRYVAFCQRAVESKEVFHSFKIHPSYTPILEHVPQDLGYKYLNYVKNNNPALLKDVDKFIEKNEQIGNANKYKFPEFSNKSFSPTTARYIKVLSDLETLFGCLDDKVIIEIGGGYGGLAAVIGTKYKFSKYYNIDLKEPGALAQKYCDRLGVENFISIFPDQISEKFIDVSFDIVISNYSFSECNEETQDMYIKYILNKSKNGYIIHNSSKERAKTTFQKLNNYNNFRIYDKDLCVKKHDIFTWSANE